MQISPLVMHFAVDTGVTSKSFYLALLMPDCHVYFCLQFSQMIKLYHTLGPEKFPLNEQTFYPNHTQMVSALPSFKQD